MNKFKAIPTYQTRYLVMDQKELIGIKQFIIDEKLDGFNVTMPHKKSILSYIDFLSDDATAIESVNCVVVKDGLWYGHNTDMIGFEEAYGKYLHEGMKALIIGNGGTAAMVKYVLERKKIAYEIVSRKGTKKVMTYKQLLSKGLHSYQVIIHTTPLGMYPLVDTFPKIPYDTLHPDTIAIDLIYNPYETVFLKKCWYCNAKVFSGMPMFLAQAEASWNIYKTLL
jgi:Shikimate 5-dehydrogenase